MKKEFSILVEKLTDSFTDQTKRRPHKTKEFTLLKQKERLFSDYANENKLIG